MVEAALSLRWRDVPDRVRRRVARCLLDTLACTVAGVGYEVALRAGTLLRAVACALRDGRVGPEQVAEARLADPATRAMAARVRIEEDPALEAAFPARALAWSEVVATDGRRARSRTCPAPGDPGDGTADAVVEAKASDLVTATLGSGTGEALLAAVRALPSAPGLADLVAAVRAPAP